MITTDHPAAKAWFNGKEGFGHHLPPLTAGSMATESEAGSSYLMPVHLYALFTFHCIMSHLI